MSGPRRKKKSSFAFQLATVLVVLAVLEGLFIFLFSPGEAAPSAVEATNTAVDKNLAGKDEATKLLVKIHGAIQDYRINQKKLPSALRDLVPTYFPVVPNDPSTGEPFQYVVDGSKYTLGQASARKAVQTAAGNGGGGAGSVDEGEALLALLNASAEKSDFIYSPSGKRDPFVPFEFAPKRNLSGNTPLERWPISQLKLTAVVAGIDEPVAIVENPEGKGLRAKKGMKIGINGGEIVDVLPDKVLIIESETDFTGERKTRTFEMRLREMGVKEQDPGLIIPTPVGTVLPEKPLR